MDLSIIIVNWNSKNYLRKCIQSIRATTEGIEYEIVVIDNASFDGCEEMLRVEFQDVMFIQSNRNLGFSMANNLAYKISSGNCLLFLNPDTEVIGQAITVMHDQLQRLPASGAIGCKLLNADGTVQTSCIQSFPTILNQFLDSDFFYSISPKSSLWGMAPLFSDLNEPAVVEVISGACLMMRRSVFEQVGLFSDDYFMYTEDIDLCFKIAKAGFNNWFIPNGAVSHFGGGSTKKAHSEFAVAMMRESVWRYLRKTEGKFYGSCYRISMLLSAVIRTTLLFIISPKYLFRKDLVSWRNILRKYFAILKWSLIPNYVRKFHPANQ